MSMDRYVLLHNLGAGSFGTVAVGRDKATNSKVALKFISKGGKQDAEIKGLKKECEIQKNLHHPNIIQMLDSFETDEAIVVVTELAHGDLYKVIPQYARWHASAVQKIACDLVTALHFLHSQRILHRDLKPQNILIGIDGKAKLCDFGFARMIAINSFMLTSMKGTPLYMAPEIILEKPYDQNTDLWSLGCILYELLVGQPPFHTNSLFVLRKMMEESSIVWHDCIVGEALPFLQGLLEKDPKKRLTWPDLLYHPYVHGKIKINRSVAEFALTKALSPSQELVKETERQQLQTELEQCSRVYRKAMKKYAQAQKKLKRWNSEAVLGKGRPLPMIDFPKMGVKVKNTKLPPASNPQSEGPPLQEENLSGLMKNLKLRQDEGGQRTLAQKSHVSSNVQQEKKQIGVHTTTSSPDATTSSSDCETESDDDSDDDGRKTVIQEDRRSNPQQRNSVEIMAGNCTPGSRGSGGVLFTLDTSGSTEFVIDTDEWLYFLMRTMKEVLETPQNLCQKPFLTMVVAPLKNTSADARVLEKIAVLLSLPFTMDDRSLYQSTPGLLSDLQTTYVDTKVLPLLLFACKLIIVNRVQGMSLTLEKIAEQLTDEDLDGLEKCFRLVTFLVHIDENFMMQFCDSVCVLKLSAILQLFLKLDGTPDRGCDAKERKSLTVETITVLCHLLRVFPNNKSIVEDVVLTLYGAGNDELWRLISHPNPVIQSKSLRLFVYLFATSERTKREFTEKRKPYVWNVLRKATISSDQELRETSKFATQVLNYKSQTSELVETNTQSVPTMEAKLDIAPELCQSHDDIVSEKITDNDDGASKEAFGSDDNYMNDNNIILPAKNEQSVESNQKCSNSDTLVSENANNIVHNDASR